MAEPEERTPSELLCDLLVYAPLGFAFEAPKLVPELAAKGRNQVANARTVGRFVVSQTNERLGPVVGSFVNGLLSSLGLVEPEPANGQPAAANASAGATADASPGSPTAAPREDAAGGPDVVAVPVVSEPASPPGPVTADDPRAADALADPVSGPAGATRRAGRGSGAGGSRRRASAGATGAAPASAAGTARTAGAGEAPGADGVPDAGSLGIPEYDSLAASQVVPRLAALAPEELAAVRSYEEAHRGRRTILSRIDQLLARPASAG